MSATHRETQRTLQLKYIQETLVPKIIATNESLASSRLISAVVSVQEQLDGYMSAIFNLVLTTEEADSKKTEHRIIVKLMKGDAVFRTASKSYAQFANEVFIYNRVLPRFKRLLLDSGCESLVPIDRWVPRMYYGFFGAVAELSALDESILALQDLRPQQFRNGPHLLLNAQHLRLMLSLIGQYHALSYALKLRHPADYAQLVAGLVPMPFVPSGRDGDTTNLYTVLYDVALKRCSSYLRRTRARRSPEVRRDCDNMFRRWGERPVELLEWLRRPDDTFAAILHGDYNRNNVLFRYAAEDRDLKEPLDVRMIDFQEVRFASPAFDLAFFMYMNSDLAGESAAIWDDLLKYYHENMINTLVRVTGYDSSAVELQPYSFERFLANFEQHAFYGALVCMHFTPWKVCAEADCDRLAALFESNMYGTEFYDLSMSIGGDEADERIAGIVEDASRRGYMRIFESSE